LGAYVDAALLDPEAGSHYSISLCRLGQQDFLPKPGDYLNFFSFHLGYAFKKRVDMPGVELLDDLGVPLFMDSYPESQRYTSFQLYQRGTRWSTLRGTLGRALLQNPRRLLDEWAGGMDMSEQVFRQLEHELIARLHMREIRYLDFFTGQFDHVAHGSNNRQALLEALQDLDGLIGRIWSAIRNSALWQNTVLVLVSDHGMNASPKTYSQGYNLIHWLVKAEGGGHHVFTHRPLLMDYSLKSLDPRVPPATIASRASAYLKGQSGSYPTALFDSEGNERAAIHLRNGDLNRLHILLQQLERPLPDGRRGAIVDAFFDTLNQRRPDWSRELAEIRDELATLRSLGSQPQVSQKPPGGNRKLRELQNKSFQARLDADLQAYSVFERCMTRLLSLSPADLDSRKIRIGDVIPKRSLGSHNSLYDLQNYIVGPNPDGMVLQPDGRLDLQQSFQQVNYLKSLAALQARNNVQPGVGSYPVDFIAIRIPREVLIPELSADLASDRDAVWLYASEDRQALLLSRQDALGTMWIRYLPVAHLAQDSRRRLRFQRIGGLTDLPLKLWEDPELQPPVKPRADWLEEWHSEAEWFGAIHRTQYSNGLISLCDHFTSDSEKLQSLADPSLSREQRLLRRFRLRQWRASEPDLLVFAANHWNFNVRGFNPGGNHGSFFYPSTRGTLMFSGGGIPRSLSIQQPYDTLSFVPTLLSLTGRCGAGIPATEIVARRCGLFPGSVIVELWPENELCPACSPR